MVELLPILTGTFVDRRSRERLLAEWIGPASDAAAAAIAKHHDEQATRWLEAGRSVLWTQTVAGRSGLDALILTQPRLAGRLYEVRAMLDAG
ncbi:hypothetical protein [Streptomyces sp. NPDC126522]|uniref:hypothetical protein n=1 Tax=Streptomyces sp. NPDC126522 TaxID=3155211 RepID=UPI00331CFC48